MKPIITLGASLLLALSLSLTSSSCGSGSTPAQDSTQQSGPITPSEPTDAQTYANGLADSLFARPVPLTEVAGITGAGDRLETLTDPLPEWLDALISRESIVTFSKTVMPKMATENEFLQRSLQHFRTKGWNAFAAKYNTRPANASFFITGLYRSPDDCVWASFLMETDCTLELHTLEGGNTLYGAFSGGRKGGVKITWKGVNAAVEMVKEN